MDRNVRSASLKVPGASIYYEARGSGPTLLLIPGGPTDAGVFTGLAGELSGSYTVVAYDPRGNSRSTFDAEPVEQQLDVHGDDAALLIEALGGGPAYVFGNSGGAQIGLNLTARHPELVRALVAHEPPCLTMLPDPSRPLAEAREIHGIYLRDGVGPAMQRFMEMSGLAEDAEHDEAPEDGPHGDSAPEGMPPEAMEAFARIEGNMAYFLGHGLLALSMYRPDVEALRAGRPRVLIGVGEATAGEVANRTAVALAEALGSEPVVFPGDHGGYGSHAKAFAKLLCEVFEDG